MNDDRTRDLEGGSVAPSGGVERDDLGASSEGEASGSMAEKPEQRILSRRHLLGLAGAGALVGGARLLGAEPSEPVRTESLPDERRDPPPADELVNTLAFEREAERTLSPERFQEIRGGDREAFDRRTFRPRMNVPVLDMDLGVDLFGERHFSPILVGPVAEHGRYHQEGELATVRGAGAAHASMVIGAPPSVPVSSIAAEAGAPLWCAVYAADPEAVERTTAALDAGVSAVVVTVGASRDRTRGEGMPARAVLDLDWAGAERVLDAAGGLPVLLKGVIRPADAEDALARGMQGVIVSNHGGLGSGGEHGPMDALSSVVEAVGGRVPVLVDGSFRRGTDVLKALILGAQAVLLGRPVMWGLGVYGADGVRLVIQLVQHELARSFAMLGVARPDQLTPSHLRTHTRATR